MKEILIIAGPSAVGKTTVASELIKLHGEFSLVRSVTTRAPRGDGFDGEYIYVDRDRFYELAEQGQMLEQTEYAGNLYGTPLFDVERILGEGRIPLLILDIDGVVSIEKNKGDLHPCAVYVYDELSTTESRLRLRFVGDSPTADGYARLEKRMCQNVRDYKRLPELASLFYSFVHNGGSKSEGAGKVASVFADFLRGAPRNLPENEKIAARLSQNAERYKPQEY